MGLNRPVLTVGPKDAYAALPLSQHPHPVLLLPWQPQTLLCVPAGYRGATLTPGCYELLRIHIGPPEEHTS